MSADSPLRPFTAADARTMTSEQITAFWLARQQALRAQGQAHYGRLVDAATGEVLATA
jgi:hypothetical protein